MSDVSVDYDQNNRDVLYARRVEMFFTPNPDGTESLAGKVVWHTQWWHFYGEHLRAQTDGPRIEVPLESVLGDEYAGLPAPTVVAAIKAAFVQHARAHLGLPAPEAEA